MQAVLTQQNQVGLLGSAVKADKQLWCHQAGTNVAVEFDHQLLALDTVGHGIGVGSLHQRHGLIEKAPTIGLHRATAFGIVRLGGGSFAARSYYIAAIERIVEAAPTGIGGIECEPGIHQRHHQLGSGDIRNLGVDVLSTDLKIGRFRYQITNVPQKLLIAYRV